MSLAGVCSLLLTIVILMSLAIWQASSNDAQLRLIYRLTLPQILAGGVSCPAIPAGYRTDHAAIAEDGYDFGEFFIDARVDLATCDATSLPVARMGRRSVLRWWIDRCTGDYAAIGSTISVQYPGEALHYVRLTRSLVDKGCGDLDKARQIIAED